MSTKNSILIIDSNQNFNQYVFHLLYDNNYMVYAASSGIEGQSMITSLCPDMIILDSELEDSNAIDIVNNTRSWSNIPIIIISTNNCTSFKVSLLDAGADDYITKPFHEEEFLARIRMAFRHHYYPSGKHKYVHDNLTILFDKRLVIIDNNILHLTNIEYKILSYLAGHNGTLVTYDDLMTHVWGPYIDNNTRILRVNMTHIRKKIETDPSNPVHIITEAGIGYRMNEYKG